jgi:hypothetical protein
MSRWVVVVVAVLAVGCDEPAPARDAGIDGSVVVVQPPPQCPALPALDGFNFFGEACVSEPAPTLTLCRDLDGWCIDNVCRPQCGLRGTSCPACPLGTEHISPSGACYCAPN